MSVTEIGRRLKNARLNAGFTQAEVAEKLKITYQAISNYERGINKVDTDTLIRLCEVYGIKVSQILTSPVWDNEMLNMYKSAKTDEEKKRFIELWGTPAELMEAENNRREPDPAPLSAEDEAVLYAYHHAESDDRKAFVSIIGKYIPVSSLPESGIRKLIRLSEELNPEGLEKLIDTADDMVRSGKYKKYNPDSVGKKEA